MDFHTYSTLYDVFRGEYQDSRELFALALDSGNRRFAGQAEIEHRWIEQKRPYYSVWPAITEALLRTRLDVPANAFELPVEVLSIRFPIGREPDGFRSMRRSRSEYHPFLSPHY